MLSNNFIPLELEHKNLLTDFFRNDPPQCSELNFTNLFIWRHKYHPAWLQHDNCLLLILIPENEEPFGLEPIGTGDKSRALNVLCGEIGKLTGNISVKRVSEKFVNDFVDNERFNTVFDRNNSDYVYSTKDLINLSGRKFHRKKNHLNRFIKDYEFEYESLDIEIVECFLDMQEEWCRMKECVETPDLLSEDYAIHEALTHFEELDFKGGAIKIDSRIEAFSVGEYLNDNTAVIHMEKANPEIQGLYTAINQLFVSNTWQEVEFINREQDLGIDGLRKAKESYNPHHMINKYIITPK